VKKILMPKVFQPFYCSSLVRLGKDFDGGYLVNETDVYNAETLISFGIGEDISFENDFYKNKQIEIYSFDSSVNYLDCGYINHTSKNVSINNIESIINGNNLFLKCDIDGGEYELLDFLIENSHRFVGAVFEFHGLSNFDLFNEAANFISKFDLRLIHTHMNNYSYLISENNYTPDVLELSFTSSKQDTKVLKSLSLPHPIDMPNNPEGENFEIIFERNLS
jgi:hypothetical protein